MGKYHIFQEITEFTPKILKKEEIYTDSEMCWLEALALSKKSEAALLPLLRLVKGRLIILLERIITNGRG